MSEDCGRTANESTEVRAHLEWLSSITDVDHRGCPCRYAWRLDGSGWVRMNTEPGCPVHRQHGRMEH